MNSKNAEKAKWYVLYTYPRWEKKVHALLVAKGIQSYCPLNKVRRKWSDRIKVVEEPVFKSYVFVKVTEGEKSAVRMTSGVVNFVYWLGKPGVVREREIVAIKKFLDEYEDVEITVVDLKPDQRVRIDSGLFMDLEADVVSVKNQLATIRINSLGLKLLAKLPVHKLKKIG